MSLLGPNRRFAAVQRNVSSQSRTRRWADVASTATPDPYRSSPWSPDPAMRPAVGEKGRLLLDYLWLPPPPPPPEVPAPCPEPCPLCPLGPLGLVSFFSSNSAFPAPKPSPVGAVPFCLIPFGRGVLSSACAAKLPNMNATATVNLTIPEIMTSSHFRLATKRNLRRWVSLVFRPFCYGRDSHFRPNRVKKIRLLQTLTQPPSVFANATPDAVEIAPCSVHYQ
jgi:hypothetical protein